MTSSVERSAEWLYRGVWRMLVDCFRVPDRPPTLPVDTDDFCRSFQPSRNFLAYQKFQFWVVAVVFDLIAGGVLAVLYLEDERVSIVLACFVIPVLLIGHVVLYIAVYLRYDTMWYVITHRSLRARCGIWVIYEHTITFENVQNVYLRRGPLQTLFGISELVVETAGSSQSEHDSPFASGNSLRMQGLTNPTELRELIMQRVRDSRSAGLGDETRGDATPRFSAEHLNRLREIRDAIKRLG